MRRHRSSWAHIADRLSAGLSSEELASFSQLSMSLGAYVGREVLASVGGAAKLLDLISRVRARRIRPCAETLQFQANSFALTSGTDLSNVGVAICPLAALRACSSSSTASDARSQSRLRVRVRLHALS